MLRGGSTRNELNVFRQFTAYKMMMIVFCDGDDDDDHNDDDNNEDDHCTQRMEAACGHL